MSTTTGRRLAVGTLLPALLALLGVLGPVGAAVAAPRATGPGERVTGVLLATAAEPHHPATYAVRRDDGRLQPIRVRFATPPPTGARISAVLRRTGDGRPPLADVVRLTPTRAHRATAGSPVTHHLYLAAPTNLGAQTRDASQLLDSANRVAAYWKRQSGGTIAGIVVSPTVRTYASTATTSDECGFGGTFFDVVAEAEGKIAGFVPSVDQVVVFVPNTCPGLGLGMVGRTFADGGGSIVSEDLDLVSTVAHEMGHNYGLAHANIGFCADGSVSCAGAYYGIYDVMGFAIADGAGGGFDQTDALSTALREYQQVTVPGEVQALVPSNATPDLAATLRPRTDDTGVRGLKVTDPATGVVYYLDYRTGVGEDAGNCYVSGCDLSDANYAATYAPGVTVSRPRVEGNVQGIDFFQTTASGGTSLAAGDSWTTPSGAVRVTVTSAGAAGADVAVHYAPLAAFTTVGKPTVTGSPQYLDPAGLTADPGTWSPTPTGFTYQWLDASGAVLGEGPTFFPGADLVTKAVRVKVTATAPGTTTTSATSDPITITPADVVLSVPVKIAEPGPVATGSTLTATPGSIAPDTGDPGTFQWYVDGQAVPGATATTYVVRGIDAGRQVMVSQAWSTAGYTPLGSTSDPVTVAGAKVPAPTITGTPQVGLSLTAATTGWTVPSGTTWTYAWYADGTAIAGATAATLPLKAAQLGRTITVRVTALSPGRSAESLTSGPSSAVAAGTLTGTRPRITGIAKVGSRLTAVPGTWTTGTTLTYAWFANGVPIAGQTRATLLLARAQRGKAITVAVTGTRPGYTTLTKVSRATAPVAR